MFDFLKKNCSGVSFGNTALTISQALSYLKLLTHLVLIMAKNELDTIMSTQFSSVSNSLLPHRP